MDAKTSSRSDLFGRPDFESDEPVIFYPIYTVSVYVSSKHPTCECSIECTQKIPLTSKTVDVYHARF